MSGAVVVVLAAGRGSRFRGGEHKLAQALGGASVLATTLSQVLASGLPIVVVTTAALADIARGSVATRDIVILPDVDAGGSQALGMGYSIASGVSARPDAGGWLILPGDMPLVKPQTLQAVARDLRDHTIAYAQHHGLRGHPVGFSAELYSELAALGGDDGARRILARYPAHGIEVDDPGVLIDIDTEADLEDLRAGRLPVPSAHAL
jgi:molybdenum cofactor cytidylyltransferase